MTDLEAIDRDIAELKEKPMSYAVAEKLAWLYVIRDHCAGAEPGTTRACEPVDTRIEYTSDTAFSRAITGREASEIWPIMDELMSTLKGIQPRLYQSVMRRLQW